jgi:hypothetical protein
MGRFDIRTRSGQISAIIQGQSASSVDGDAQAFFDRVTAAGGTLTQTEKDAVNTLVLNLKSNSLWTPMLVIYPMVGGSAAACAQNLKSSSFVGIFNGTWTFANTGVTPNGTNAYINTNLTPNVSLTAANFHLSYYSRTNNNPSIDFDMGVGDSFGNYASSMFLRRSNNQAAFDSGNSLSNNRITASSQTNSQGFYVGSITSTSNRIYIKNGSTTLATSTATNTNILSDGKLFIAAYNETPYLTPTLNPNFYGSKQCAFSSIGDGLNTGQIANFYTAVQTFQTSLSRNV